MAVINRQEHKRFNGVRLLLLLGTVLFFYSNVALPWDLGYGLMDLGNDKSTSAGNNKSTSAGYKKFTFGIGAVDDSQSDDESMDSDESTDGEESDDDEHPWEKDDFVGYIQKNPQRSYFSHFVAKGGLRKCIEIGVQDGRFSEIFLHENRNLNQPWMLVLVDPAPTDFFFSRFGQNGQPGSWEQKGYLKDVNITFEEKFSTDPSLLAKYPDEFFDFVYLDALHTYEAVKAEMPTWWNKVRRGGIFAGHDYCNYGEEGLSCIGCKDIPECGPYTREGSESAESKRGRSSNQHGVVMAVQEWMVENGDPSLAIHHTVENFTRESLGNDGIDYDMVIRRDRNPSWFIIKP